MTRDIHEWFGLSYSSYLVLNRSLLQSMPEKWQTEFVARLDEMSDAYRHIDHPSYEVQAVEFDDQLCCSRFEEPQECDDDCSEDCGTFKEVPIPIEDPIPHYNRGHTYIEPTT